MRIAFIDFEATDKDVKTARITQSAISIYEDGKEIFHHSELVYKDDYEEINPVAAIITGIRRESLVEFGVLPADFITNFFHNVSTCDYICGHNIKNFDIPLLEAEMVRAIILGDLPTPIDTRFDLPYPDHIDTRKLLYLAAEYGYANPMAHSARHDVDATAFLFYKFKIEDILKRASSPNVWIKADVSFDTKELAKERKFSWNAARKIWVKQIKLMDLADEAVKCKFKTSILENYDG